MVIRCYINKSAFCYETLLCWQLLAVKSLRVESMKVYRALKDGNIIAARKAVSMIVGRDTEQLDEAGLQGRRWRLWLRALPTGL